MLKKIFITLSLLLALITVTPVLAQYGLDESAQKAQYGEGNVFSMITTIISLGLSLVGLVFLGIMFYAGLRWMSARGNEEHVTKAKDAMFAALMGFILIVSAYALTQFVLKQIIK